MKRFALLFIMIGLGMADVTMRARPFDDYATPNTVQRRPECLPGRNIIAQIGDSRSVLGPQGKNIAVAADGKTIAVTYAPPSDPYNVDQPFNGLNVAYSTDMGAFWSLYGPFSTASPLRRVYNGVDGCDNFQAQAGNLFFVWQEGQSGYDPTNLYTMIEENIPSTPSFTTSILMSGDRDPWMPCIGVNPEDNANVLITAWSYQAGGNKIHYSWISTDGGYSWSDTIRMIPNPINALCYNGSGHFRWGSNDYIFFTYHDTYLSAPQYPHYVESTDGGFHWSVPAQLPALTSVQFWWTELDCEVIENKPYAVHGDIGGGGVMQLFYPDPDNPGSPGAWNWQALSVPGQGEGSFLYHDTTYNVTVAQYPSIACQPDLGVILVAYPAVFDISPAPAGFQTGIYIGGILSTDEGRSWYPCRPLSGLQTDGATAYGTEVAHRLRTINDTTYSYATWEDAGDGAVGNQYFELGVVMAIQDTIFGPGYGIAENNQGKPIVAMQIRVVPTLGNSGCRISFSVPKPGAVKILIYDALGRLVESAFNGNLEKGDHSINLNTTHLANGVYLVDVRTPTNKDVAKFIISR